jgi:hypothetical protein
MSSRILKPRAWQAVALLAFGLGTGCSTEVDLNAPYERTPIVFGLLETAVDTQWVRINRTWLGDGNQFDAALIADSSEYVPADINARAHEMNGDEVLQTFVLRDTVLGEKEPGLFYGPDHQAWYFVPEGGLNAASEYQIEVDIADGDRAVATTNLIASVTGNITQPPAGVATFKYGFANIGPSFTTYPDLTFKWASTAGASRYDVSMDIHVTEKVWADDAHTELLETRNRVLTWAIGSVDTNDDDGGEVLSKVVNGEQFFSFLANRLEENSRITRELGEWDEEDQIARALDFKLSIANDALRTYLDVNDPVTGVIQERPEYTNITGGLGLWASRDRQSVNGIGYTTDTMEELLNNPLTAGLNFCTPNPFSEFSCN